VASATFAVDTALTKARLADVSGHDSVALLETILEQVKVAEASLGAEAPPASADGASSFELGGKTDFSDWM
jgi:hypothetical protein